MIKYAKITIASLTALCLLAGCSEGGGDSEYGNIKTINTPDSFAGNIADINDDYSEVELKSGDTYAVISIQSFGEITCKLYPEAAPEGVQNFIDLANSGYYTGKDLHRVIKDFMMQGGSANGDGMSVDSDPSFNVEYCSKMRHYYGALCYANAGGINGSQFYIVNSKSYSDTDEAAYQAQLDQYDSVIEELKGLIDTTADESTKTYYQQMLDMYTAQRSTPASQLRARQERTDEMTAKYEKVGGTPYLDGGYTVFGQTVKGFDVIDAISEAEVETSSSGEASHPVQEIIISSVEIKTAE